MNKIAAWEARSWLETVGKACAVLAALPRDVRVAHDLNTLAGELTHIHKAMLYQFVSGAEAETIPAEDMEKAA